MKNGQILIYCHFNKIIKGPGTSFQSPALSQTSTICGNTYDDVTIFEICVFHKNKNLYISRTKQYFFLKLKN